MHLFLLILIAAIFALLLIISLSIAPPSPDEDDGPDSGSPIPPLTAKAVEKLAYAGGTDTDIADRFMVDPDQIRARFAKVLRTARALRRLSIRGWEMDLCRKLNGSMLIWIGKNELGQANKPQDGDDPEPEVQDN